jgi:hypothetical protein
MCDFHSCCIRVDGALAHVAENSHSSAAAAAGWKENEPLKRPRFVEAEWDGIGEYPGAERITRVQAGEELTAKQRRKIDAHYQALAAILKNTEPTAEQLGRWNKPAFADVLARLCIVKIPAGVKVWRGDLAIASGVKLEAPDLEEVSGYVDVRQGATFTAPVLEEVSGSVDVQQGATFTAPVLAKAGYVYVRQGATFTAPVLAEVSGSVDVQQGATFTAPKLGYTGGEQ